MKNNFVITAMPRSGTKFLTKVMNRSDKFTVLHDHQLKLMPKREDDMEGFFKCINDRLYKENYGEISGWFRNGFEKIEASKKGLILRHPVKNIISLYNMNGAKNSEHYLINIYDDLINLDRLSEIEEIKVIKFQDMTRDIDYLDEVLRYFGIDDVKLTDRIISEKVNKRSIQFTYENFDKDVLKKLEEECGWFIDKYELEMI